MSEKKICPTCGASMMEHKHGLSRGLVSSLRKFADSARINRAGIRAPFNLAAVGLSHSEWDNFQKLRYWGFVEKATVEGAERKSGYWKLTNSGLEFLAGRLRQVKYVWTYRGEAIRFEGPLVYIHEIKDGYKYRVDYAEESRPRAATDHQAGLF